MTKHQKELTDTLMSIIAIVGKENELASRFSAVGDNGLAYDTRLENQQGYSDSFVGAIISAVESHYEVSDQQRETIFRCFKHVRSFRDLIHNNLARIWVDVSELYKVLDDIIPDSLDAGVSPDPGDSDVG